MIFLFVAAPFLLVLRYRVGIARRPARRWVVRVNLLSLLISTALFLWVAAITNFWVPRAFGYSLIGFSVGVLLGLIGLTLTRWEAAGRVVYYTPNRTLVLLITLAVATRMAYGMWRVWHAWHTTGHDSSWLASAGIPGSMSVGAVVLGHYLTYFAGVLWRIRPSRPR